MRPEAPTLSPRSSFDQHNVHECGSHDDNQHNEHDDRFDNHQHDEHHRRSDNHQHNDVYHGDSDHDDLYDSSGRPSLHQPGVRNVSSQWYMEQRRLLRLQQHVEHNWLSGRANTLRLRL